jgi:hypothetical protein
MARLADHLEARDMDGDILPECSDQEMWAKEDNYAIKRTGNKSATKVISSKPYIDNGEDPEDAKISAAAEAGTLAAEMNAKLKGKEADRAYFIEHRPGERTKCLRFCDARIFCSQFKEYSSVAFREKEPVG